MNIQIISREEPENLIKNLVKREYKPVYLKLYPKELSPVLIVIGDVVEGIKKVSEAPNIFKAVFFVIKDKDISVNDYSFKDKSMKFFVYSNISSNNIEELCNQLDTECFYDEDDSIIEEEILIDIISLDH